MYTLKIEQLHCMSCFHNIEEILKDFDPMSETQVLLKLQQIKVESKRSLEEVKKKLEAQGYDVEVVT